MKKQIWILVLMLAFILPACGGGGGSDSGAEPEILNAFVFDVSDPDQNPIMEAYIGDIVAVFFCIHDPDLDANQVIASQYYPVNAASPYYEPIVASLEQQGQADQCYVWGNFEIIGPSGDWLVRLEIKDAQGHLSLPYDIEPFRVF